MWFDRSRLPGAPAFLFGILELTPRGGVVLELHVARFAAGEPSIGFWFDERGRRWGWVAAGHA